MTLTRARGFLFFLCLLTVSSAHAIITRDDVPDTNYVVADASYPAIVDLLKPDDCIGTLVDRSYLMTVAHCAADLKVGHVFSINGTAHTAAKIIIHPKWKKSADNYDIALVLLASPVTGVTPVPIYRESDEVGSFITMIGRGVHATGLVGEKGATDDYKLRRATNIVSAVSSHFIEITFRHPGEPGITDLEGVGAAGDSGGAVLIDVDGVPHIAGLNSFGVGGHGIGVGQYGARDYQTRVSRYLDFLDKYIGQPLVDVEAKL